MGHGFGLDDKTDRCFIAKRMQKAFLPFAFFFVF